MRNAYVVVKDMIDLIPENEEERFQILKHNLSKNATFQISSQESGIRHRIPGTAEKY